MAATGTTVVDAMASEIFNRGPIACGIDASKILDYTSDIASGYSLITDHIISVVGCDNDAMEREYWILRNSWREFWGEHEYIRVKSGWFSNLALGQQCARAVPGDFSVPERDDPIHCWDDGENCDVSNESPETKPYKSELLSQDEVESRGFVWNGNSSTLSVHDALPEVGGVLPWTSCAVFEGPDADSANFVMSFFDEEVAGSGFAIFFSLIVLLVIYGCFLKVVDCVARVPNDAAKEGLSLSWFGSIISLENVRFHVEEEEKGVDKDGNKIKADAEASKDFRSSFAKVDGAFCSDAFGTAHRAHSSMVGDCFPLKCSGFLVEKELDAFAKVMDNLARLVLATSGGAKVRDKIQPIKNTLDEDDYDAIVVVAVGNYHSDGCRYSPGRAVMSFNVDLHDLGDDVSYFSDFGSCVDACTSRGEYSDEVVNETEAMAVEVEAVDFPEVDALTGRMRRLFAMLWLKKCWFPLWEHLRPGACLIASRRARV